VQGSVCVRRQLKVLDRVLLSRKAASLVASLLLFCMQQPVHLPTLTLVDAPAVSSVVRGACREWARKGGSATGRHEQVGAACI
jgi:hypothetical protein